MGMDLLQDSRALDKRRSGRYGTAMIEQVAKMQSDIEYIKRDVAEMKTDMREMRNELSSGLSTVRNELGGGLSAVRNEFGSALSAVRNEFGSGLGEVRNEIREVRNHQERDFRILFGALIGVAVGLAGMFAKGFGWL